MARPLFIKRPGKPEHKFPVIKQLQQVDLPPPRSPGWLPIVLAAWTAAPIIIWQSGLHVPVAQAEPVPYGRAWAEIVRSSWEPAQNPQQGRRFFPLVNDNPPPRDAQVPQNWELLTWNAQRSPETPQVAALADSPPFGKRAQVIFPLESKIIWQSGFLAQDGSEPDKVSYERREIPQWEVTWSFQGRRFAPQAPAVVDNPPTGYRPWVEQVVGSWSPAQIISWQSGFLAQDGQLTDSPPFGERNWLSNVIASWELVYVPQPSKHLVQGAIAAGDDPPFGQRRWSVKAWDHDLVPMWVNGPSIQTTDQVPSLGQAPHRNTLLSWEPEPWPAQGWKRLVQPAVFSADQPLAGRQVNLYTQLASWEVTYPPQGWKRIVQPGVFVADNPPFNRRLQARWEQELVPLWVNGSGVQPSDNPPGGFNSWQSNWTNTVLEAWQPVYYRMQEKRFVVPPIAIDNPPTADRSWLSIVSQYWEPPPHPAQGWKDLTQPEVTQTDDPPFGQRPWLNTAISAWQPPAPPPVQLVHAVTDSGPTPVPPVLDESQSTPGRIIRKDWELTKEQVERRAAESARHGRVATPPDMAAVAKSRDLVAEALLTADKLSDIRLEIERLREQIYEEGIKRTLREAAQLEKQLLLAMQQETLLAVQAEVLREEMEVIDIAYVALMAQYWNS